MKVTTKATTATRPPRASPMIHAMLHAQTASRRLRAAQDVHQPTWSTIQRHAHQGYLSSGHPTVARLRHHTAARTGVDDRWIKDVPSSAQWPVCAPEASARASAEGVRETARCRSGSPPAIGHGSRHTAAQAAREIIPGPSQGSKPRDDADMRGLRDRHRRSEVPLSDRLSSDATPSI